MKHDPGDHTRSALPQRRLTYPLPKIVVAVDRSDNNRVAAALHMAGTPVSTMASVHCAAATQNFIALEHHFNKIATWGDLIDGVPKPIIQNGYIPVPEGPGLGFELNLDAVREHLVPWDKGFFEPTPEWDDVRSHDRLWS